MYLFLNDSVSPHYLPCHIHHNANCLRPIRVNQIHRKSCDTNNNDFNFLTSETVRIKQPQSIERLIVNDNMSQQIYQGNGVRIPWVFYNFMRYVIFNSKLW